MTLEERNRLALKKFIEYRHRKKEGKEEENSSSKERDDMFHYTPSFPKNKLVQIDLATLYDSV